MATCPGALSIVGEHHQGAEEDEKCAARAIVEELPGLQPLMRNRRMQLHLLRKRPRWFLFDYPLGPSPSATPRYDRCLIAEYVLRLEANATEANTTGANVSGAGLLTRRGRGGSVGMVCVGK